MTTTTTSSSLALVPSLKTAWQDVNRSFGHALAPRCLSMTFFRLVAAEPSFDFFPAATPFHSTAPPLLTTQ
jgi:hypothetical protein